MLVQSPARPSRDSPVPRSKSPIKQYPLSLRRLLKRLSNSLNRVTLRAHSNVPLPLSNATILKTPSSTILLTLRTSSLRLPSSSTSHCWSSNADTSPSMEESKIETEGTILVAATPTPSVSSNSQSQPHASQDDDEEDYSLHHRQPEPDYDDPIVPSPEDAASQESMQYPSSEPPTASYRAMYDNLTPPLEPTQILEPTQLFEPTQLIMEATQIMEPTQIYERYSSPEQTVSVSNVTNTTAPKSLMDALPENKRHRYAHIPQIPRAQANPAATAGPLVMQATQPAFNEPDPPPSRVIGMSKPQSNTAAPRPRPVIDDRTEIIPDSEPPREASPSPLKSLNKSPLKPRPPPAHSSDTDTDNEVVPDSMDVDGIKDPRTLHAKSIMMREEEEEDEEEEEGRRDEREGETSGSEGEGQGRRHGSASTKAQVEETSDDELLMPTSEKDQDISTESPDEDDGDDYVQAGPSRKRKRAIKVESPNVPNPRKGAKAPRAAKRPRAASGSVAPTVAGTRVFALWRKDGSYYSGTVHSQTSPGVYRVDFDDSTSDNVKLDQMRLCVPKVGDTVFIVAVQYGVKITSIPSQAVGRETVVVAGQKQALHVSDLRIPARTIAANWGDERSATVDNVVCQVDAAGSFAGSPTASRMTEKEKEAISALVCRHGGIVIPEWDIIFSAKGQRDAKRWILRDKDAVIKLQGVQRIFLLSEDSSHTTKYLIALALGIPCLRTEFVQHAIDTEDLSDWTMFLLPSGFSEIYQCRASQFVNMDWGEGSEDLHEIMSNPVAHKALKGKKILCVSPRCPQFLWEGSIRPFRPSCLCMGATSVEAVRDIKNASLAPRNYDYIINKDNITQIAKLSGSTVISWDWVKNALIGRCVPDIP
ncbi:hypothetical protein C8R46DRAFT_1216232 [Mycena filopes]|nr:hypothetical protein C8R46DRAFT_1216232 [Mycena filopes]